MSAYAKAGAVAEEVFGAIRTVVGFGGQAKEGDRYANNLVDARKINIKKSFFAGLGFGLLWFFIYATYALAFWYGVGLVIDHRVLPPDEMVYDAGTMFTVKFCVYYLAVNITDTILMKHLGFLLSHDGCNEFRSFIAIH